MAHFALPALLWLLLLGQWAPLNVTHAAKGLDHSWEMVVGEAAARKFGFGSDLVFTDGPLNSVYTHYFNAVTFPYYLAALCVLIAASGATLTAIAGRAQDKWLVTLLFVLLCTVLTSDTWLISISFATALVGLGAPRGLKADLLIGLGASAAALAALAKFSSAPLSLAAFVMVDALRLSRRSFPIALPVYLLVFFVAFEAAAPEGSDFLLHLEGSLQTVSGWTAAMALPGSRADFLLYVLMVAAMVGAAVLFERREGGRYWYRRLDRLMAPILLAIILWLTLKAGFVRQDDQHMSIGFGNIALASILYALARGISFRLMPISAAICAAVVVTSMAAYDYKTFLDYRSFPPGTTALYRITHKIDFLRALTESNFVQTPRELGRTLYAVFQPRTFYAGLLEQGVRARAATAAASPIKSLDGTIDSVVSIQSALLSAGLRLRPHPTLQEPTGANRYLIDRNRDFFLKPGAPDYVLFSPEAIDTRYPAFDEGALWPIFLSSYAPVRYFRQKSEYVSDMVLLKRRAAPLPEVLGPPIRGEGKLNQALPIDTSAPLFLSLDVRWTLLGSLANFVYRAPMVYLDISYADGTQRQFDLIPGIAREGFVAVPFIRSAKDFILVASGAADSEQPRIRKMAVRADGVAALFYRSDISYVARPLDRAALAAAAANWDEAALGGGLARSRPEP